MAVFLQRVPAPPLSDFVAKLWLAEGDPAPHARERILPHGTLDLVINLWEDDIRVYGREDPSRFQRSRGAVPCGTHSEYFVIDTAEQRSCMGVCFKPGGAFPFFRMPVSELRDQHVPLDLLWGSRGVELRDRLLEAASPEDKLRVLESALLAAAAHPLERHPAVRFALREFLSVPHGRTIAEVTDRLGLSPRRFIQAFGDQVGLTPKLFCRVRRFHEVTVSSTGRGGSTGRRSPSPAATSTRPTSSGTSGPSPASTPPPGPRSEGTTLTTSRFRMGRLNSDATVLRSHAAALVTYLVDAEWSSRSRRTEL